MPGENPARSADGAIEPPRFAHRLFTTEAEVCVNMGQELLSEGVAEQLVSASRATIGDQLRSVTYFGGGGHRQLYLRSDLASDADIESFVDHEAVGFEANSAYERTELGEFRYTIRVFENGFLLRVIVGQHGVFVTTDGLTLRDFDDVATALESILRPEQ
jgi:hypothetical protein